MLLAFKLSMPRNNAWNGKWTGEGRIFARVFNVGRSKKAIESASRMVAGSPYHYDFGDGWAARVDVSEVTPAQARKLRAASEGFHGYDWMISEIKAHGRILTLKERTSGG